MNRSTESIKYMTVLFQMKTNFIKYLNAIYKYKIKKEVRFPEAIVKLKNVKFMTRENTMDIVHVSNLYERKTTNFLLKLKPKEFIDIGAHIGRFSVLLGANNSKVISVEADKNNFQQLNKNIKLNNLQNKVDVINVGSSDKDGGGTLYLGDLNEGTNSLEKKENSRQEKIKLKKLDNIIEQFNVPPESVDAIKIDVEGAELNVLKGSLKILEKGSPIIVLEILEKSKEEEIKEFLKRFGFINTNILDSRNFVFEKKFDYLL